MDGLLVLLGLAALAAFVLGPIGFFAAMGHGGRLRIVTAAASGGSPPPWTAIGTVAARARGGLGAARLPAGWAGIATTIRREGTCGAGSVPGRDRGARYCW